MDLSRSDAPDCQPSYIPNEWQSTEIFSQRLMAPARLREAMGQKPASRRMKCMVANSQKDDRYWENRKRNNDAARRSRENRRKIDQDIRTQLIFQEEENALLRKEMAILKSKFNLPAGQRYELMDAGGGKQQGLIDPFTGNAPSRSADEMDSGRGEDENMSDSGDPESPDLQEQDRGGKMSDGQESCYGGSEGGSSGVFTYVSPTEGSSSSYPYSSHCPSAEETAYEDSVPMKKRRIKLEFDESERKRLSNAPYYAPSQPLFPHPYSLGESNL